MPQAYVSQMIFMTSPLFAAIANRVVLKQPTPYGLWPTVFLTITGAVLVVVGQLQQNSEETGDAGVPSTGGLILGCCLALLSTLLLTAYLIFIQASARSRPSCCPAWASGSRGHAPWVPAGHTPNPSPNPSCCPTVAGWCPLGLIPSWPPQPRLRRVLSFFLSPPAALGRSPAT